MMSRLSLPRGSTLIPIAMLGLLAACAGTDSPTSANGGAANLSVSFATPSAAVATNAAGNAVLVGTSNDSLVITKVQMVLENVKLRRAGVTACPDSMPASTTRGRSHDDKGCSRLDLGPMLLDLPLNGTSTSPLAVTVPAGTYHEFEFELEHVSASVNASQARKDFLAAHPELKDVSVVVTGTYKGTAFTFKSNVKAEVEFEFEPSLVVETGVNDNVSISLDLSKWFKAANGSIVAPTVSNQLLIDQNILNSFDAFGDRDRDGHEDSGRGSGHGHDGSNHG